MRVEMKNPKNHHTDTKHAFEHSEIEREDLKDITMFQVNSWQQMASM